MAETINEYKDKVIAIRGNCDSEVDQMLMDFPMLGKYSSVLCEDKRIFMTHGHEYNETNIPPLKDGDILAYGHTHIPLIKKKDGIIIFNPGSISLPKENGINTYGIMDNNQISVKDFYGNIILYSRFN